MESRGKRVINIPARFRSDVGANSLEADESKTEAAVDTNPSSGISSTGAELQQTEQLPPAEVQSQVQLPPAALQTDEVQSQVQLPPAPAIGRVRQIPARFRSVVWAESLRNYKSKSKQSSSAVKSAASSSSSSTSVTRLPKITVGYATNDALYKDIIGMLLAGMSISAITTVLCNANNKYREILTQNARPDQECTIAKDAGAEGLKDYKNAQDRNIRKDAYDVDPAILDVPAVNGLKRPFYLALVLDKTKGKKRMTSVPFTPSHMGDCGNCWLCNLPVHYYWQNEKGYTNTTGCGDCEHVGAIVAAFLAGMLSNQGNPDQFKYNYHPSHPHCNKWKSNTIPMKFDKTSGKWVHDTKGITTIAKDIANHPIHGSEYCPKFIKAYNNNEITVESVKTNIKKPTEDWCTAANKSLARNTDKNKTNIASALASIIAKTAPKLISTTTVKSVKKVKMQRKQSGGCGAGEHIFVEEIPGEHAVNIYDTNTFYELKPTDDEELDSLQTEYNAIFDESAGEEAVKEALDIVFECLFNVFDAIEDPYEIGSGVTGILNVLSRYLYGLDQDAVKNQELIDDISSRIRTITMKFGDELNETDYEVLDISHDAPAKVVSSAIVSPLKKQDIMTRDIDDTSTDDNEVVAALTDDQTKNDNAVVRTKRNSADITNNGTHVAVGEDTGSEAQAVDADKGDISPYKRSKSTPVVGESDTQDQDTKIFESIADRIVGYNNKSRPGSASSIPASGRGSVPISPSRGGKRLNKRQSKHKSQKRNQKNKTKRISYIKNKQTRKNKHSKKTKSKRSNKK